MCTPRRPFVTTNCRLIFFVYIGEWSIAGDVFLSPVSRSFRNAVSSDLNLLLSTKFSTTTAVFRFSLPSVDRRFQHYSFDGRAGWREKRFLNEDQQQSTPRSFGASVETRIPVVVEGKDNRQLVDFFFFG